MNTITRDDIIRMAEGVGIPFQSHIGIGGRENISTCGSQSIQKITRLVELAMAAGAAAEREACARICGERAQGWAQAKLARDDVEGCMRHAAKNEARALGEAIRQRGRWAAKAIRDGGVK